MAGFNGNGSVSYSGSYPSYTITWTAPSITWTTGSRNRTGPVRYGGASTLACGSSDSAYWYASEVVNNLLLEYETTPITVYTPACPPTYVAPTISMTATRTSPTTVRLVYSVYGDSSSGNISWTLSGTGSPYTSTQTLAAGSTKSETIDVTVTPSPSRYTYTLSASNLGGSAANVTTYAPATNPSALPSGSISISQTTDFNTLSIYYSITAPTGTNNGNAYYAVTGPGIVNESGILGAGITDSNIFTTDAVLSPGTNYTYTLTIYNNYGTRTYTASGTTKTAVEAVTNLAVSSITDTTARVSWTASSTAGATYTVSSTGGTVSYTSGNLYATISGLSASTTYTVTVAASANGYTANASKDFTTDIARTITASISAVSSSDGRSATVSWTVTKTTGVILDLIEVDGPGLSLGNPGTTGSVTVSGLSAGGTYTWYIDVIGHYSTRSITASNSVTLTTNSAVSGAPTAPFDFLAKATSPSTVSLTWTGSTSAGGFPPVTYYISGPGTINSNVTTNTYATVTGLTANTAYTWTIYAKNTNPSTPNTSANVTASTTTLASATGTATLVPNISAESSVDGTSAVVTWSTVNYGTSLYNMECDVYAEGTSLAARALNGSTTVTGLTPGSSYTFVIDVAGYTRANIFVGGSDSYTLTMSNPSPAPAPTPVLDKIYYYNGSAWVQATEAQVYNGSWVAGAIKTSDGQGHWT